MNHRYYYTLRPAGIGCQPDGFSKQSEVWMPKREVAHPADPDEKILVFGWVDYPEPLDTYEMWKKDLIPASEVKYLFYRLWLHLDRPEYKRVWDEVLWIRQEVAKHPEWKHLELPHYYNWALRLENSIFLKGENNEN